jgi:hypothetical protein
MNPPSFVGAPQHLNAAIIQLIELERLPMAPMRLKGSILLAMPKPRIEGCRNVFMQSLELSRAHGSRAWEPRTATDMAAN